METNQTPQKNSEWVNRLDFSQRNVVVQMYVNGLSISAITKIYQVHHSSVRYHLKKAGVYVKGRYGTVNIKTIEKYNPGVKHDYYNTRGEKMVFNGGLKTIKQWQEQDPEKHYPKSYKEYVQREKDRTDVLFQKHGIKLSKFKLPDPDRDPDVFIDYARGQRRTSNTRKRREELEETNPVDIGSEDTITNQGYESIPGDRESDLQSKGQDELSITF